MGISIIFFKMKYITLLLLGLVSAKMNRVQESTALAQIKASHKNAEESESDSDNELVQIKGDNGIIDALTPPKGECEERLWIDEDELNW